MTYFGTKTNNKSDGRGGDLQISKEGGRGSRQDEGAGEDVRRPQDAPVDRGHGGAVRPGEQRAAKRRRRRASRKRAQEGRKARQAQDETLGGAAAGDAQVGVGGSDPIAWAGCESTYCRGDQSFGVLVCRDFPEGLWPRVPGTCVMMRVQNPAPVRAP